MATVKHAAQKSFAPVTTTWTVAFKWTKTTNYGLVNKYDVMPAGGMQVEDVIHDMSLNLSLDHVTNQSNDQDRAFWLPTWPSEVVANTERPDSPRDPTWPSATNAAAPASKAIYQSMFINKSLMHTTR